MTSLTVDQAQEEERWPVGQHNVEEKQKKIFKVQIIDFFPSNKLELSLENIRQVNVERSHQRTLETSDIAKGLTSVVQGPKFRH